MPAGQFRMSFVLVALVGLVALVDTLRLSANAGAKAVGK
jgi:hypothetical protein